MGSRGGAPHGSIIQDPTTTTATTTTIVVDDDGVHGGCHGSTSTSNVVATTGMATLPGVNRRSNISNSSTSTNTNASRCGGLVGGSNDEGDEERQHLISTSPTSMDGTESSLEMPPTRKDE